MTKRYREAVEVELDGTERAAPTAFRWRGGHYRVLSVLGFWREDGGWWAGGGGIEIPQRDLWRLEAGNGDSSRCEPDERTGVRAGRGVVPVSGIYELLHEGGTWKLDRVWD